MFTPPQYTNTAQDLPLSLLWGGSEREHRRHRGKLAAAADGAPVIGSGRHPRSAAHIKHWQSPVRTPMVFYASRAHTHIYARRLALCCAQSQPVTASVVLLSQRCLFLLSFPSLPLYLIGRRDEPPLTPEHDSYLLTYGPACDQRRLSRQLA